MGPVTGCRHGQMPGSNIWGAASNEGRAQSRDKVLKEWKVLSSVWVAPQVMC